jgi:hypothetical protein
MVYMKRSLQSVDGRDSSKRSRVDQGIFELLFEWKLSSPVLIPMLEHFPSVPLCLVFPIEVGWLRKICNWYYGCNLRQARYGGLQCFALEAIHLVACRPLPFLL